MYTPKIIWYQTDVTVVIRIMLYDLKDYFLRVMRDHLLFSTTMNDRDYYVCLYLFGTVMAEKTTHVNKGREIEVRLIKAHKWTMWLRLQIEKDKNPHIIADSANLYEIDWTMNPDEIDAWKRFQEYKRANNLPQILPVVPSSDEEESDDDYMDSLFY
ncbi:hypothetical protein KM043_015994 [Ampulex compressa]|nr:hypothetical protein KM043_015994 [Ampulex compressa]